MTKVLIPQDITEAGKKILQDNGYEVIIGTGCDEETIKREAADCDAIIARTAKYPRSVIESANKLKIIARYGIGVDNIDIEAATQRGIWVTNSPRSSANAVAEHTMLMMLSCAKNMYALQKHYRGDERDYTSRGKFKGMEISGKTLAVIGLGRIGRAVAQKAQNGFGMKVIAYDPFVDQKSAPEGITMFASFDELLPLADFVSLHMPLMPSTRQMVDMDFLTKMKHEAFLLNMARGEIVSEEDLVKALKDGIIKGAGLDVLEEEPPTKGNPLFEMENVIITPHNASMTKEAMDIMGIDAAQSIMEVIEGRIPQWKVNDINK